MRLLLVRHGIAIDPHVAGDDESRWLTEAGRQGVREQARRLHELGVQATRIYSSPLVRAMQTAELLAHGLGFVGPIRSHGPLSPSHGTAAQALAPFEQAGREDLFVMVSHMPKVRAVAAQVAMDPGFPPFHTAQACLFSRDRGHEWTLDPRSGRLVG